MSFFNPGSFGGGFTKSGITAKYANQFTAASTQYFQKAASTDLTGDIDLSICGWVRVDTLGDSYKHLVSKWVQTADDCFWLEVDQFNDKMAFKVKGSGGDNSEAVSDVVVVETAWTFFRAWHDKTANVVGIQLDGGTKVTSAHTEGLNTASVPITIGGSAKASPDNLHNGAMGCIGIWTKVISDEEVVSLMNDGRGLKGSELTGSLLTSLYDYFDLTGATGNEVGAINGVTLTASASRPTRLTLDSPFFNLSATGGPSGALTFEDTFSGAAIDTDKWNTEYWFGWTNAANAELQVYKAANVTVGSGTAKLIAKSEVTVDGATTYNYSSGLIATHDKFYQTYGYFEARLKVPSGQGFWPAFWMLPQDRVWPPEIDILEILGHAPSTVYFNNHYGVSPDTHGDLGSYTGADFSADFHVFAMRWTSTAIKWYVDDVLRYTVTSNVPQEDMYILLNLAVGGNWPGSPNGSTVFPSQVEIDYVRAYAS